MRTITAICIAILGITAANATDRQDGAWYSGFFVKGAAGLGSNFVKSGEYPIGTQYEFRGGGSLGYSLRKVEIAITANYHDEFYAVKNGYVIYRKYSGLDAGLECRVPIVKKEGAYCQREYGIGGVVGGCFDKYDELDQYMIYPQGTVELFAALNPRGRMTFLSMGVVVPIRYAFRTAGHYMGIGLAVEMGLRVPQKT